MEITGYSKITYKQLQSKLQRKRSDQSDVHELTLAAKMEVKSVGTVRNCFDTDKQTVSDEIFTKLFKVLGMDAIIVWIKGERNYLIKE